MADKGRKSELALLRIAALKRQQAESQYQSIVLQKREIDAEISRLRGQVSAMSVAALDDVSLMMASQQYAERLIAKIKGLERARDGLLPALGEAQRKLQKAMFSESQLKLL